MTPEQLKEIEDRANAASPSPWRYSARRHEVDTAQIGLDGDIYDYQSLGSVEPELYKMSDEDGQFIAHSRQDIPALIAEVRRLQDIVDSRASAYTSTELYWDATCTSLNLPGPISPSQPLDIKPGKPVDLYVDASNARVVPGWTAPSQSLEIESDKQAKPVWEYDHERNTHICHYSAESEYRLVAYLVQTDRDCVYNAEVEWLVGFGGSDWIGEFYDLGEAQEAAIKWAREYEAQE